MQPPVPRIRLFGAVDLRFGDRSLPLPSARAETLLAYLLLHRDAPQPRQRLAFMLWPDSTEAQARTNLRHVLHDLRRALPDADRYLDVTPRTLRWRPDAPFWLDVASFEDALVRAGSGADDEAVAALREAVDIYCGDLLDGSYDDWVLAERDHLRTRYLAALERLATLLGDQGDVAQAIPYAERILHHDSLNEAAYRLLMRLYHTSGQQARALQIYHLCSATLERELGVAPSPATRQAYDALVPADRDRPAPSAPRPAAASGGPSLVGRASEWRKLTAIWEDVERQRAQLVLVTGEPGVGKTRLIEEFRSWTARRGAVTAVARSYASEGDMAFGPLVAWLRSAAFRSRLDRLDRAARADLAPLLPDLLPTPTANVPPGRADAARRQRLFDAGVRALLAVGGPMLLVADDIQWWDPDTLHFLHYLLRAEPLAPLLVAATARREEIDRGDPADALVAGLLALDRIAEIELERLGRDDTVLLAAQLAGRPLGDLAGDRLFRETEGNPLFVVEAVRSGWGATADPDRISPKVQAVIEARFAQVSEAARDLVDLAATIGREFSPDVLAHASDASEETLVRALDELWRRRIVREQGAGAYDFSHDKIREVAYLALSPARRRHHHLRVAAALETLHADDPGPVSGQLAMHYERAGAVDQTIAWYVRAAEAAQRVVADAEAARLLDRARDLLLTLPETPARGSREMAILAALAASLGTAEGFASTRLADVHRRAHTLTTDLGVELAPPLLRSLAIASLAGSDYPAAQRFGRQLRARGERDADDVLLVESAYVLGIAAFWQGQFAAAREQFAAAVARYRPDDRRAHLLQYGLDPKVICLSRLGNTLWFLGHADAAAEARDCRPVSGRRDRAPLQQGGRPRLCRPPRARHARRRRRARLRGATHGSPRGPVLAADAGFRGDPCRVRRGPRRANGGGYRAHPAGPGRDSRRRACARHAGRRSARAAGSLRRGGERPGRSRRGQPCARDEGVPLGVGSAPAARRVSLRPRRPAREGRGGDAPRAPGGASPGRPRPRTEGGSQPAPVAARRRRSRRERCAGHGADHPRRIARGARHRGRARGHVAPRVTRERGRNAHQERLRNAVCRSYPRIQEWDPET